MNALGWSGRLQWGLDLIALIAVLGTGEVRPELFALVAAMFLLSRFRMRFPMRVIVGLLGVVVLGAVTVWFKMRFHPIVAAAYAAPLVQATIWLAEDNVRNRGWRLAVGFVELILASALTAEVYLFLAIFAYVILGSVVASCNFLEGELRDRSPENRTEPLPAGFIGRSLGLAGLIFLMSLLIFPILPRVNTDGHGIGDSIRIGYTENVNLTEKTGLNGNEGTGQPVLWLYPRIAHDLTFDIHMELIRGRALDNFDGATWTANSRRTAVDGIHFVKPADIKNAILVDVVRGSMPTNALPVPYGTIQVFSISGAGETPFPRTKGGEWFDSGSENNRSQYSFAFLPFQSSVDKERVEEDPPLPSDLQIPEVLKSERMLRLVKKIFEGARTEREKVERLSSFLAREGFHASLESGTNLARTSNRRNQTNAPDRAVFIYHARRALRVVCLRVGCFVANVGCPCAFGCRIQNHQGSSRRSVEHHHQRCSRLA